MVTCLLPFAVELPMSVPFAFLTAITSSPSTGAEISVTLAGPSLQTHSNFDTIF